MHLQKVRETFSSAAHVYPGHFDDGRTARQFCFRRRLELACELASYSSGRLLDCAAGTGEITAAVLRSGAFTQATVVDFAPEMLVRARDLVGGLPDIRTVSVQFVSSDIFQFLPLNSQRYDLILCLGLIAHTGRLDELLQRLYSVLSRDGRILLQTTLLDHFGTKITRALTRARHFRQHGYHISYFRARDVERASQAARLRIVDLRRFGLGLPFADKLWASANHWLERRTQVWAERRGAEAIYVLAQDQMHASVQLPGPTTR